MMESVLDKRHVSSHLSIAHAQRRPRAPHRRRPLSAAAGRRARVSRQTINSIEKERYMPSLPLAIAIARFFRTTVEEVFHADH
jgi:putative transcriptional regulator